MTMPTEHDILIDTQQWVCLQCGYNMIGQCPRFVRFAVLIMTSSCPGMRLKKNIMLPSTP